MLGSRKSDCFSFAGFSLTVQLSKVMLFLHRNYILWPNIHGWTVLYVRVELHTNVHFTRNLHSKQHRNWQHTVLIMLCTYSNVYSRLKTLHRTLKPSPQMTDSVKREVFTTPRLVHIYGSLRRHVHKYHSTVHYACRSSSIPQKYPLAFAINAAVLSLGPVTRMCVLNGFGFMRCEAR